MNYQKKPKQEDFAASFSEVNKKMLKNCSAKMRLRQKPQNEMKKFKIQFNIKGK